MSNWAHSAVTVFGVILVGAALALSVIYIQQYENSEDKYYGFQVGSVLTSTVVVGYIVVMIAYWRPYNSFAYTLAACTLLVLGLALEVVFDQWSLDNTGKFFGAYSLAGMNALLRLFFLIQVRCSEPLTTVGDLIRQAEKIAAKTGQPAKELVKQVAAPLSTVAPENLLQKVREAIGSVQVDDTDEKGKALKRSIKDAILTKAFEVPPKTRGGRR
jgi:hypothetical protein